MASFITFTSRAQLQSPEVLNAVKIIAYPSLSKTVNSFGVSLIPGDK